jgi:hypothetical protein
MSSKQGPRHAGMRTAANVVARRKQGLRFTTSRSEVGAT